MIRPSQMFIGLFLMVLMVSSLSNLMIIVISNNPQIQTHVADTLKLANK